MSFWIFLLALGAGCIWFIGLVVALVDGNVGDGDIVDCFFWPIYAAKAIWRAFIRALQS